MSDELRGNDFKTMQKWIPEHILVPLAEYFSWSGTGYWSPVPEMRVTVGSKIYILMIKEKWNDLL